MHVAGDLFDLGGTFIESQLDVAGDVFHGNIAVLVGNLDVPVATGDGDIAAAGNDLQRHFPGDRDIEIALHGVVAGRLGFGIEVQLPAGCGDGRIGLGIVFVGVALAFRADTFADGDGDLVVVRDGDVDRAVIVADAQAVGAGRYALLEASVETIAFAEEVIEVFVVDVEVLAPGRTQTSTSTTRRPQ